MPTNVHAVTVSEIKYAIENRDGRRLASMYADDAVLRIVDRDNPPSKPREIRGKKAIAAYWDDVCGRTMTHKVEEAFAKHDELKKAMQGAGVVGAPTIWFTNKM